MELNPDPVQSSSCFDTQSIIILSFHLNIHFPSIAVVVFSMNATCPTHTFLLYLITLITLNEEYKLQSNSHSIFLIPPLFGLPWLQYYSQTGQNEAHRGNFSVDPNMPLQNFIIIH
jgi:hypothetical protein